MIYDGQRRKLLANAQETSLDASWSSLDCCPVFFSEAFYRVPTYTQIPGRLMFERALFCTPFQPHPIEVAITLSRRQAVAVRLSVSDASPLGESSSLSSAPARRIDF
jgi:hypothetical protein